ncbi:hypothetical protein BSNK01_03860 [Bacillaceae bacterium]
MEKAKLAALLFFFFVLEGTIVQAFVPDAWGSALAFFPRFVLVALIFTALFKGRRQGLWYGISFGLLQDILYSDVIGVYAFTMAFIGYFAGLAFRYFQPNVFMFLLTITGCLFIHETIAYGFFRLFGLTGVFFRFALAKQVIPTVVFNLSFALLVYLPLTKFFSSKLENDLLERDL